MQQVSASWRRASRDPLHRPSLVSRSHTVAQFHVDAEHSSKEAPSKDVPSSYARPLMRGCEDLRLLVAKYLTTPEA
jgi:hypothetical protein